jgi:glycosyltransferase involved in cell wall biosynthesis
MRVAFVSPLPPAPTGVADYASDVLALLTERHEVEAFHDQTAVDAERVPGGCRVFRAERLAARHAERRFDAIVYQLGNAPVHGFVYPLLQRLPGLLVLHDLVLHHARARMFLDSPEVLAYVAQPWSAARRAAAQGPLAEYAAELRHAYPEQAERLFEVQLGTLGPLLPYAYPLCRRPIEASRATAVHNEFMAAAVREEFPARPVFRIPMPMTRASVASEAVDALRARYGIEAADFVVGSFGLLTPEKRIATVALSVARAAGELPRLRLLLVGPVADSHGLDSALARAGVRSRTIVTGRVPLAELPAHMALVDLAVHLRYPTARETSAALLRLLAQGRATVMSDLEHLADVPQDAVVRADVTDEEGTVLRAILRLARRPEARAALGASAAAFVAREHVPARALAAYEQALAASAPASS